MEIPDQFVICEASFWIINHRLNSALPGYLMVASKLPVYDLSDLPNSALTELGPLLAEAQRALQTNMKPVRIYIGRYGHSPGFPIHFHIIPVYDWVEDLFWCDERYRVLEHFIEPRSGPGTDGAELTLFIWREFCERPNPPPIKGPSVSEVIALLRDKMTKEIGRLTRDIERMPALLEVTKWYKTLDSPTGPSPPNDIRPCARVVPALPPIKRETHPW